MKDLTKIYNECISDLKSYNIDVNIKPTLIVNNRAKKRWGQANYATCSININARLLNDDVGDFGARNCMMHELLHLITPGSGHTGEWKTLADEINKKSKGKYVIKRTSTAEEYGLKPLENSDNSKYVLECNKCGLQIKRERMSNFVKHPSKYSHRGCTGKFKRVV